MRIRHNDYGQPPAPARQELTVTVVIPAHGCQDTLDLTLAALSAQTYPAGLMDVVVVDDGSPVPLTAPKIIRAPEGGWGRAWAVQAGVEAATGDVVLVLDADMVPVPEHVAMHMRWHHLADYLVVLGWIDFTSSRPPSPEDLLRKPYEEFFDLAGQRHDWAEAIIEAHDGLRTAPNSLAGHVHVGATASYRRAFLLEAGGLDTSLVLAEDTELGYRLTQAGAVFVPDPEARAWHLGLPTAMRDYPAMKRHNDPYVADRVPYRRYLRTDRGRQWLVPYVDAVVVAEGYEDTRAAVDALLASDLPDLRVTVVGAWDTLAAGRRSPLNEPLLDLRLLYAAFEHDSRVRLATVFEPSAPFVLRCPPGWTAGHGTVSGLVQHLEARDGGLLNLALEENEHGVTTVRLERTAAFARARRVGSPDEALDDVVHELFGVEWLDGRQYGFARRPATYPRRVPQPEPVDKEVLRLRKRIAALQAETQQLRREAAKGARDAERWKGKAEAWRREAVKRDRTVLRRAVRKIGLTSFVRRPGATS
ncbi:glycosyltransferase [Nonomuraea soli]|uniref:GT2 family glycosyltransferase n=1 Tax=Nonomuraea soli TaxID=1032476 RepID=A0A7W0CKX0_9ACTN|nr:glycosyltransferase [Nonomuraea soli]MBA2893025.1 GT2 family glycosyltransferase [Nonomuraea soli]